MTRHRSWLAGGAAALTLWFAARPAAAQGPEGRPRPDRATRRELAQRPEEMRETLVLFYFHRVRTELALSDEQATRLLPLIQKVEQTRRDSEQRRRDIAQELERLASDSTAREADVTAQIKALDQEDERSRAEQGRLRDEMLVLFTPPQKARFVLLANRLRRQIEERMRGLRPGGGPGGGPGQGPDPGPGGGKPPFEAPPPPGEGGEPALPW